MNYGHFPTHSEQTYTEQEQSARACVRRGIEWLDEHIPDWRDNVDPYCIQVWSHSNCVLAQATNDDFGKVLHTYNLDPHTDAIKLGFNAPTSILGIDTQYGSHSYNDLDNAWKELLRATTN